MVGVTAPALTTRNGPPGEGDEMSENQSERPSHIWSNALIKQGRKHPRPPRRQFIPLVLGTTAATAAGRRPGSGKCG
jgi:hypothetical protein